MTSEQYICPHCGHIGRAAKRLRGSAGVERFMWYCLLVPGPFYSFWRRSSREIECSSCNETGIVALESKLGAIMLDNRLRGR